MCVCVYVCSWYIHHHYFPEMARLMGPEGMHLCVCVCACVCVCGWVDGRRGYASECLLVEACCCRVE